MNQNTLNCKLAVGEALDRFIKDWKKLKGEAPRVLYVNAAQMTQLKSHLVEGASADKWEGIPLRVVSG